MISIPSLMRWEDLARASVLLARKHRIDRVVGVDDFDITTAAEVRELLGISGMDVTTARQWKDKLSTRRAAARAGVPVPAFIPYLHEEDLQDFLEDRPGPWILKPRAYAGAVGMRVLRSREEALELHRQLGDGAVDYILEEFVPGDIHHVDGIVAGGVVRFAECHAYGRPTLQVAQQGGVFTTRTMDWESVLAHQLRVLHGQVVAALGMENGVTHVEFIVGPEGSPVFLVGASRVAVPSSPMWLSR